MYCKTNLFKMKFDNRFYFIIIGAIGLYATFLFISDFSEIGNKLINFKIQFIPIILVIITSSWLAVFARWVLLLRNSGIHVPLKQNYKIYLAGFAFAITPGRVGELIKSQLMKNQFGISRTKTVPIIMVERFYDLLGAVIVSFIGVWLIGLGVYIIIGASVLLVFIFLIFSSRRLFNKFLSIFSKWKYTSRFLSPLSESYEIIRASSRGKIVITATLFTIIYWLVESIGVYFVLIGYGIEGMSYVNVVSTYVTSLILGAASLIPAGLGVTEGSLVGLFSYQNIELSEVFGLVVIIRLFTLWYSVIIGFIALKLSGGFSINTKS